MKCPYCHIKPDLVTGKEIYPHREDLHDKNYYLCPSCSAYVGCHAGTTNALGFPANQILRSFRSEVHTFFDPLWKNCDPKPYTIKHSKLTVRGQAYSFLAKCLSIPVERCHISQLTEDECLRAVLILESYHSLRSIQSSHNHSLKIDAINE